MFIYIIAGRGPLSRLLYMRLTLCKMCRGAVIDCSSTLSTTQPIVQLTCSATDLFANQQDDVNCEEEIYDQLAWEDLSSGLRSFCALLNQTRFHSVLRRRYELAQAEHLFSGMSCHTKPQLLRCIIHILSALYLFHQFNVQVRLTYQKLLTLLPRSF